MGRRFVNMMSVMKTMMMAAVLLLAMHTANAVRCRVANGAVFTHLMAQNTVCDDAACTACGSGTEVTSIEAAAGGINSATLMLAYVNNICPSMMWRDDDGVSDPSINAVTLTSQMAAQTGNHDGLALGVATANRQTAEYDQDQAAVVGTFAVCPCSTPSGNTCPTCGCADLGMPTSAPSAAPTTAPSATPTTDNGITITGASDDSLSGGAIAGIVIGSIVGAALVIGAGVMIGSK